MGVIRNRATIRCRRNHQEIAGILEAGKFHMAFVDDRLAMPDRLASEGGAPRPTITGAVERVEAARNLTPYTSTQENAWMVLAARALAKDAQTVTLDVGGERAQGVFNRNLRASDLQ